MTKSDEIIWDGNICPTGEVVIKDCYTISDYKGRVESCHWDYWNEEGQFCELNWSKDLE